MIHEVKMIPKLFQFYNRSGLGVWDIRAEDHGYQLGDTVLLKEYSLDEGKLTGNEIRMNVVYVLRHGDFPDDLTPGTVELGCEVLARYIVR